MPTLLTQSPALNLPPSPPRKRWTRTECVALESAGLFEKQRLELVDGELISKMGKNRPHVNALRMMLIWLQKTFGEQFVDVEAPIDVSPQDNPSSEPEPDVIVLHKECSTFTSSNPKPADIALLVEIADTTLDFDLSVKALLYARAGILEYWVLDVNARRLIAHRNPQGDRYASITAYAEQEWMAPLAAPDAKFCAALSLLPQ